MLIETELGGRHVIRDAGLLMSAAARPRTTLFGAPAYPGLAGKAAAVLHSLVTSHPLLDGNKRVGIASTLLFYALNGVRLTATDDELFDITMAVAAGRATEVEAIAERLAGWEAPLGPGTAL